MHHTNDLWIAATVWYYQLCTRPASLGEEIKINKKKSQANRKCGCSVKESIIIVMFGQMLLLAIDYIILGLEVCLQY